MSAAYTLDNIRAAAEAKYGSTDIDIDGTVVRLLNPLRLPKERRDILTSLQGELNSEDIDIDAEMDKLRQALVVVAETPAQATLLLDAIGDDLALLAQVFETYGEGTQVGEASASAS